MSNFFSKQSEGKVKEEIVLDIVRKVFPNSKIYENKYFDWGEQTNQDYIYNGKKYECPDIFSIGSGETVIVRTEIKGFRELEQWGGVPVVKIPTYLYDNYLRLQNNEETPCLIVFPIGETYTYDYDYFWQTLSLLDKLPKKYITKSGYKYKSGQDMECVYWRVSDLNSGIDSFVKHLQNVKDWDW